HQKYGFSPEKPHWIRRMADAWEYVYFKDISKPLDSYDAWSFRISPDGYRKVDADFRDEDEIRDFLGQHRTADDRAAGATLFDHVEAETIPASEPRPSGIGRNHFFGWIGKEAAGAVIGSLPSQPFSRSPLS